METGNFIFMNPFSFYSFTWDDICLFFTARSSWLPHLTYFHFGQEQKTWGGKVQSQIDKVSNIKRGSKYTNMPFWHTALNSYVFQGIAVGCWRNWKAASQVDHRDDQMGRNVRKVRLHARVRNCCRYIESHDGGEEVDHWDDDKGDNVGKGNQDRASSAISWEEMTWYLSKNNILRYYSFVCNITPYSNTAI